MEDRYGLIVDGSSLTLIMPVSENKELLFQIAEKCSAVVCCRMSPLQKAEIVKLMKSSPLGLVTAAIGDGGNDVSMIQEAHVGIGIIGREGRAARKVKPRPRTQVILLISIFKVLMMFEL